MKKEHLILIITMIIVGLSCHKDVYDQRVIDTQRKTIIVQQPMVQADLFGSIVDLNNEPIANATISVYDKSTFSDENGNFSFESISMNPSGTQVKVITADQQIGGGWYIPNDSKNHLNIEIDDQKELLTIDPSISQTIKFEVGTSFSFLKNSFIKPDGQIETGEVSIYLDQYYYKNYQQAKRFPLSMLGHLPQQSTGITPMYFGMQITAFNQENEELSIDPSKLIMFEMQFPDVEKDKLTQLHVMQWNNQIESWEENGKLELEGNLLTIEALGGTEFLLSNPVPYTKLCGTLTDADIPLEYYELNWFMDDLLVGKSQTNENGEYCMLVPRNEELRLEIRDAYCDQLIHQGICAPIGGIDTQKNIKLSKKLEQLNLQMLCDESGDAPSEFQIKVNKKVFRYASATDQITIPIDEVDCFTGLSVRAYNKKQDKYSKWIQLEKGKYGTLVELETCNN